jgi:hypothetical protein
LTTLAQSAGEPWDEAPTASATTRSTRASAAIASMKPATKASPFERARGVVRRRTIAMVEPGLIAAATASGRMSPEDPARGDRIVPTG